MKNITEKDLSNYKKIYLINSRNFYKKNQLQDNACYIFINDQEIYLKNSYKFSWSEFKKGYDTRCQISKKAFKFSIELEKNFINDNVLFFKLFNLKFKKEITKISFKKSILNQIYEYLYLFYVAKEIQKSCKNVEIINDSKDLLFFEKKISLFNKNKIIINKNGFQISDLFNSVKNLFFIVFYQLFAIFLSSNIILKKKSIKFGLRFYDSGFNLKTTPKVNWVFKNLKKKDYSVICESLKNLLILDQFKKKKINFIINSNRNLINHINLLHIPKYFFNIFFYFFLGVFLLFKNRIIVKYINQFIKFYIKWEKFTDVYNIGKYISYHNYDFEHIIRNFLLKRSGCETFHYKHTFAENVYEKKSSYNNYNYGFLSYDTEFHWGPISHKMSIKDRSQSKKFISNGPISSQFEDLNKKKRENLICFFTSQLGSRDSICSKETHEKFLNFIIDFSENKKLQIILRPKYKIKNIKIDYPEIYKKLKKLKKIKNVRIIEKIQSEKFMFQSNKIVSMPFASTTIQGLYNEIPSYYLDLNKQFKNIFYKQNNVYFNEAKIMKKELLKKNEFKKIKRSKEKIFNQSLNVKKIDQFFT